ncbi:hypothetical protein SCHPADRAFT_939103 [Schizopora paradoxa]|uniref:Hydrophobin n=1 Tax=Schizopora paradoxa TaxID=27342 RepID=A0A0H2RZR8_9AGAM|nr:hypothetical protein SCHPADRAFT_939103 [Schizopora paradoxa]
MKFSFALFVAAALSVVPAAMAQSACGGGQIELGVTGSNQVIIFANDCGVIDQTEPGNTAACNNGFIEGTNIVCNNGDITLINTPGGQFGGCVGASNACGIVADAICCRPV